MIEERAPAKVNLVLHVGARRADGLHELASLFASLSLHDVVRIEPSPTGDDEVVCPGVSGPNLAEAALRAFRREVRPGALGSLRVRIEKRIPVAAGLGGGSADAAAVLRVANRLAGEPLDSDALRRIAMALGADVPSQVAPAHALVTGAGEVVEPVELPGMALVLVPQARGLSSRAVYAEADRLGAGRPALDPGSLRALAARPLAELAAGLENDLEPAALALRPELARELTALRAAGALAARVTGSGPAVFGVWDDPGAAARVAARWPGAILARA